MDIYSLSKRRLRGKKSSRVKRSAKRTSKRRVKRTNRRRTKRMRTKRVSRRRNVKNVKRKSRRRVSRSRTERVNRRRNLRVMRGGAEHDGWFDVPKNIKIVYKWQANGEWRDRLTVNYSERGFVLGRGSLKLDDGSKVKLCGPSSDTTEWNFMDGKYAGSRSKITVPKLDHALYNLHFINNKMPSVTQAYDPSERTFGTGALEPETASPCNYDEILVWFKQNGWGPIVSDIVLTNPQILDLKSDKRIEGDAVDSVEQLEFGGPKTPAALQFSKLIIYSESKDATDISEKLDSKSWP